METSIKTNWTEEAGRIYLMLTQEFPGGGSRSKSVGWYRQDSTSGQFRCVYTQGHREDHECSAEADARGWLLKQAGVEL